MARNPYKCRSHECLLIKTVNFNLLVIQKYGHLVIIPKYSHEQFNKFILAESTTLHA